MYICLLWLNQGKFRDKPGNMRRRVAYPPLTNKITCHNEYTWVTIFSQDLIWWPHSNLAELKTKRSSISVRLRSKEVKLNLDVRLNSRRCVWLGVCAFWNKYGTWTLKELIKMHANRTILACTRAPMSPTKLEKYVQHLSLKILSKYKSLCGFLLRMYY